MRLIDTDELLELYEGFEDMGLKVPVEVVVQSIKDMPTAYDIDKVVEQLEKERGIAFVTLANTGNKELDFTYQNVVAYMDKAIEIVKSGGQNG